MQTSITFKITRIQNVSTFNRAAGKVLIALGYRKFLIERKRDNNAVIFSDAKRH